MNTRKALLMVFMNLPFIYVSARIIYQLMPAGIFVLAGYLSLIASIEIPKEEISLTILYIPLTTCLALLFAGNPSAILGLVLGYILLLPTILLASSYDLKKPSILQMIYLASILYIMYIFGVSIRESNVFTILSKLIRPEISDIFQRGLLGDTIFIVLLAPSMVVFIWKLMDSIPLSTSDLTSSRTALKALLITLLSVLFIAVIAAILPLYSLILISASILASLTLILYYSRRARR